MDLFADADTATLWGAVTVLGSAVVGLVGLWIRKNIREAKAEADRRMQLVESEKAEKQATNDQLAKIINSRERETNSLFAEHKANTALFRSAYERAEKMYAEKCVELAAATAKIAQQEAEISRLRRVA